MKISVIVQSHNRPRGLRRLLACLASQSIDKTLFEVVISDDSLDSAATGNIVDEYSRALNINYRHTAACGAAESMQEALSRAGGEYIKIIHDDDLVSYFSLEDSAIALDEARNSNIVINPALIRHSGNDSLFYKFADKPAQIKSAGFAKNYEKNGTGPLQSPVCSMFRRHAQFRAFWEYENPELREFARRTGAGTDVQLHVESALSGDCVLYIPRVNSILCTDMDSCTQTTHDIARYYQLWADEYNSKPSWRLFMAR